MEATDSVPSQGGPKATTTVVSGPHHGKFREIATSRRVSHQPVRPKHKASTHTLYQGNPPVCTTLPENSMPIQLQHAASPLFCLDQLSSLPRVEQYGAKQSEFPLQNRKPKHQAHSVHKTNYGNAKATTPTGCNQKYPNVVKATTVPKTVNVSYLNVRCVEPLPNKHHPVGEVCHFTNNLPPSAALTENFREKAPGTADHQPVNHSEHQPGTQSVATVWSRSKKQPHKNHSGLCGFLADGKGEPNHPEHNNITLGRQAANLAAAQQHAVTKAAKPNAARAQSHANKCAPEEANNEAANGKASASSATAIANPAVATSATVAAQNLSDDQAAIDEQGHEHTAAEPPPSSTLATAFKRPTHRAPKHFKRMCATSGGTCHSEQTRADSTIEPQPTHVAKLMADAGSVPASEHLPLHACVPSDDHTTPCVATTRIVNWLAEPTTAESVPPTVEVELFVIKSALPHPDVSVTESDNTKFESEKVAQFLFQLAAPALKARDSIEATVVRRERRVRTARIFRMHCVASIGRFFVKPGILTPEELELYDQIPKTWSGSVVPCPAHHCGVFHKSYYEELRARCSFQAKPDPSFTPTSVMRNVVSQIRKDVVNTTSVEQTTTIAETTSVPAKTNPVLGVDDSDDDDHFIRFASSSIISDLVLMGSKTSSEFFGLDKAVSADPTSHRTEQSHRSCMVP